MLKIVVSLRPGKINIELDSIDIKILKIHQSYLIPL